MKCQINSEEIKKIIPHRFPFLLIDRITEFEFSKSLKAIKNLTVNEHFFEGHFPGNPVMPGVLAIEAIAQASSVLFGLSKLCISCEIIDIQEILQAQELGLAQTFYLTTIEKAKFRRMMIPGDQLEIVTSVITRGSKMWKLKGEIKVSGLLAVEVELSAIYTGD